MAGRSRGFVPRSAIMTMVTRMRAGTATAVVIHGPRSEKVMGQFYRPG